MSDGFATAKIEVQQAGMVFVKRKPKLVVHIRESTWVRRRATSFGVREHLPGILYRSVIYGYFIIIGHLLLRSVPGYSNNMAYLRRYAEWVVLEKIRDNSLGENETESRPKNKYPRFLYIPSAASLISHSVLDQALIWHAWMIIFDKASELITGIIYFLPSASTHHPQAITHLHSKSRDRMSEINYWPPWRHGGEIRDPSTNMPMHGGFSRRG